MRLGLPADADPSDDVLLDHGVFVVSYNPRLHDPNWVAWRLVAEDLGAVPRGHDFHADPLLPGVFLHVLPADYRLSGYDRGHLCPSADRTASRAANRETFVMTNILPQVRALNAGPWERFEQFARQLASDPTADVYIVAGGVFDPHPALIGAQIAVPRATFKVLVVLRRGQGPRDVTDETAVYAVEMPNTAGEIVKNWSAYATTVDQIERDTGYDFLNRIPVGIQTTLEARLSALPVATGETPRRLDQ